MNYEVTFYFSEIFEVCANSEAEAIEEAHAMFVSSFNCVPIPDEVEIECLDKEDEAIG